MPTLTIKTGAHAGQVLRFQKDVEIGRASHLGLPIDDPTISRRHASITFSRDAWWVADLGSQNGTAVNGQKISKPTQLHDGDEVRVGGVLAGFRFGDDPQSKGERNSKVTSSEAAQAVLQIPDAGSPVGTVIAGGTQSVSALRRRLELLYEVGAAIGGTLDEGAMLSLVLDRLFETFPQADRGFILLYDRESNEITPRAVRTRTGETSEIAMSRTLVWDVIKNRCGILSTDAASDERFDEKLSIRLLGIRSVVCVPMIAGNEIHGVVALDSTGLPGAFEKDDMALLVGIAGQAALALANTRLHRQLVAQELLEQDLALAKKIQARFLPKNPPEVPGYDFRAFYLSAQEVGGDYYDFFALPEGRIGIALGDVSGKGISAALYMVKLSGEMRYHSVGQSEPAGILSRVNRALCGGEEEGMFATAILLVLDTRTREVKLASAGHPEPLLRRRDGRVEPISVPPNSPVGVDEGSAFEQRAFTLAPGETVVLYTDGVSEAADADRRLFGTQRLIETLGASNGSPEGALNDVLAAVSKFSEGEPQADDLTLLCFGPTVPISAVKSG